MKIQALFLIGILTLTGCNLFKKSTSEQPRGDASVDLNEIGSLVSGIQKNAFEFDYLSYRARGAFEGMGMKQNLNLNVRMKRHEKVWISVTAVFNIEVARLYMTKDSVFILQRLPEYRYKAMSLDSISRFTAVPMTVTQFQNFLIGNPVGTYKDAKTTLQNDEVWVEQKLGPVILQELIHPSTIKIGQLKAYDNQHKSEAQVEYSDFQQVGTNLLPHKVSILVSSKEINAKSALVYSNISLAEISNFPFTKPK